MMIFGQSACSAKRSMAVSSRTDDAIAPAFVAPIARESATAMSSPLPVPSCSTDTKHGKPWPFTYNVRTDAPIILKWKMYLGGLLQDLLCLPRSNHDNILSRLEVQQFEEYVVSTGNHNRCSIFQMRSKLLIEDTGLNLVRYQDKNHWKKRPELLNK